MASSTSGRCEQRSRRKGTTVIVRSKSFRMSGGRSRSTRWCALASAGTRRAFEIAPIWLPASVSVRKGHRSSTSRALEARRSDDFRCKRWQCGRSPRGHHWRHRRRDQPSCSRSRVHQVAGLEDGIARQIRDRIMGALDEDLAPMQPEEFP
jgi:hypothetical protein